MNQPLRVESFDEFKKMPAEYQEACNKLVISHSINELQGTRNYDEPAIQWAPDPFAKWQTCRVVMEEYGHHYRFFELGVEMGIPKNKLLPEETDKKPLNIMGLDMTTWTQFCVVKMLGDLAEILQVEDLIQCSFIPLRNVARMTMSEEHFHCEFGENFCTDICQTEQGKKDVQEAIDMIFPHLPAFFGSTGSKNNDIFRKYGLKMRSNEDMRADYVGRAKEVVAKLGLSLPEVDLSAY